MVADGIPKLQSRKATRSIIEKKMTISKGAKPQPCFVPFVTSKLGDTSPFSMTLARMPSWKERMMVKGADDGDEVCGAADLEQNFPESSSVLSTESNAFVRSTKTEHSLHCCSRHFSCSRLAVNIISMVLRPAQKPHWLSDNIPISSMCFESRLRITRPSILPGIDSKEIPRWSSHTERSPFCLKMCTISASLNSCGTDRLFQKKFWKRWVSLVMRFRLPALNTSAGRPSIPGALPDAIWFTALQIHPHWEAVSGPCSQPNSEWDSARRSRMLMSDWEHCESVLPSETIYLVDRWWGKNHHERIQVGYTAWVQGPYTALRPW